MYIGKFVPSVLVPSVLWRCWLGSRKGIQPVKNWVAWLCVWVKVQILHMAQLMLLLLTITCSS